MFWQSLLTPSYVGLFKGLETLQEKHKDSKCISSVFLLTDGLPNVHPPRGERAMLRKYVEDHPHMPSVYTFGFGYSLDSSMLSDLAVEGGGAYAFIPDSGFVGTTFVHAVSNLSSTYARNVRLSIEPPAGWVVTSVPGYANEANNPILSSWGATLDIGSLALGQTRNAIVSFKRVEGSAAVGSSIITASFQIFDHDDATDVVVTSRPAQSDDMVDVGVQAARLSLVDHVYRIVTSSQENAPSAAAKVAAAELCSDLEKAGKDPRVIALLDDARGQVTEAISKDLWYKKWGRHYLRSLARAHQLQRCNNFKDPGVQAYGGSIFSQVRDMADDAFLKLPPPKPTKKNVAPPRGVTRCSTVRMASYHNRNNPCFAGHCLVEMADGTQKRVDQIQRGDEVVGGVVVCVVKTLCANNSIELVTLKGGLQVTPWHPIHVSGRGWVFPCEVTPAVFTSCGAVYSFVLNTASTHTMLINGYPAVTLGHSFKGDIREHAFFGSRRVLEELKKMKGWCRGLVVMRPDCVLRDPVSTLIVGLKHSHEVFDPSAVRMNAFRVPLLTPVPASGVSV